MELTKRKGREFIPSSEIREAFDKISAGDEGDWLAILEEQKRELGL